MLVTLEDWPLWPTRCPADVDFVDWAKSANIVGELIFHMGTGTHHLVGRQLSLNNTILGITCCPAEMESYMSWAVENPMFSGRYRVVFGDLYVTDTDMLPRFNIITLFHLYERPDPRREEYGAMSPQLTLGRLIAHALQPNGLIVTYDGSATGAAAEIALKETGFLRIGGHKSLSFWKETL